jgi:tetratricopeptide (TPR) repeat protein
MPTFEGAAMPDIAIFDRLLKSLVGLVALLVALNVAPGFVPSVHAQNKSNSDAKTAKKVLEVIRSANKAFDAENYKTAFDKYEQAYELYPDPAILVRLGKTSEQLGNNKEAAAYYREFARLMPDDSASKKLTQRAEDIEAALPVVVAVNSEPSGAQIYVDAADGESVGTTPTDVELTPGAHTIHLKKQGFEPASEKINVEAKQGQKVSAMLSRTVVADQGTESDDSIQSMQSDTGAIKTIGWASLTVGVASLATSGVFLYLKGSAEDDANNYDKRAPGASRGELEELKDDANSHYDTALVTGIAGGVLVGAGAGLLTYHHFLTDDEDDDVAVNVGAGFDAEGAWFGVNGRF